MIKLFYIVKFSKSSEIDDLKLNEEKGKKLAAEWFKKKNQVFDIDDSFYDGQQIIGIIKIKENWI